MAGILLIPPLIFFTLSSYLNSSGPLWLILPLELPLVTAFLLVSLRRRDTLRGRKILAVLTGVLYLLLTAGFLLFILILPETLYQGWLLLLDAGKPGGTISFVFVYAGSLVSSLGCLMLLFWEDRVQAVLNLLLLCSMVGFILFPRTVVFLLFLMLLLGKIFSGNRTPGDKGKWSLWFLSVLIAAGPALLAGGLSGRDSSPVGSPLINAVSSGLQSSMAAAFPELPLHLNVPGFGYSYDRGRNTGEKPLLTGRTVFSVRGKPGTVSYLRSEVFYRYSENGWIPEEPGVPEPATGAVFTEGPVLAVTLETDLYTRIPHTPGTTGFRLGDSFYYNRTGGSLSVPGDLPLVKGDTLYLYESELPESESRQLQAPRGGADISERVKDLALSLQGSSREESLDNIRNYLSEEYHYTLDTEGTGSPVEDFLFHTRAGYCVHFSTSAALMARVLGIPVRIAEGFLVQLPSAGSSGSTGIIHEVTGYTAHQWPEIYSGNAGWIPWEVTPPFESPGVQTDRSLDELTVRQLQEMGVSEGTEKKDVKETAYFVLSACLCLLAASGGGICFSRRRMSSVLKRKVKRAERKQGLPGPEKTGWVSWLQGCRARGYRVPERGSSLLLFYLYSGKKLDRREKRDLMSFVRRLP